MIFLHFSTKRPILPDVLISYVTFKNILMHDDQLNLFKSSHITVLRIFMCLWFVLMCFFLSVCFRDGIHFAFRDPQEGQEKHPNVDFLKILSEFSFKLVQNDRAQLWEVKTHPRKCSPKILPCVFVHSYWITVTSYEFNKVRIAYL